MATIIDATLAAFGPAPRRYPITSGEHGETNYGPWRIYFDPPPIPSRNYDWHFYHVNYGGPGDLRYGSCASFADALNEIDEMEDEQ